MLIVEICGKKNKMRKRKRNYHKHIEHRVKQFRKWYVDSYDYWELIQGPNEIWIIFYGIEGKSHWKMCGCY